METCEFCGKIFDTTSKLKGHYGRCPIKRSLLENTLPKDILYNLMFVKNMSANYIGRIWMKEQTGYEYGASAIINLAHSYGFKTRNVVESNHNPERQKIYKETLRQKYGDNITNVSQLQHVKDKKEKTFIEHYGMRNIFCDSSYIIECFEAKYGVTCNNYRKDFVLNYCNGVRSKIHKIIENILIELNIQFESEPLNICNGFNKILNKQYSPRPDILIPSKNIIFEIQGDKWHANPKIYKDTDLITGLWRGDTPASEIRKSDELRKNHMESFGYKVYYIWEYDIKHNLPEVKQFIQDILC